MKKDRTGSRISLSMVMALIVTMLVLAVLLATLLFFIRLYQSSMEQNAVTTSEQAVVQVMNTVENYTKDMADAMKLIAENIGKPEEERDEFFARFLEIRSDVVAVATYDSDGNPLECWSDGLTVKKTVSRNLSYPGDMGERGFWISKPHVENLFEEYYPWVVTISQKMRFGDGREQHVILRKSG